MYLLSYVRRKYWNHFFVAVKSSCFHSKWFRVRQSWIVNLNRNVPDHAHSHSWSNFFYYNSKQSVWLNDLNFQPFLPSFLSRIAESIDILDLKSAFLAFFDSFLCRCSPLQTNKMSQDAQPFPNYAAPMLITTARFVLVRCLKKAITENHFFAWKHEVHQEYYCEF